MALKVGRFQVAPVVPVVFLYSALHSSPQFSAVTGEDRGGDEVFALARLEAERVKGVEVPEPLAVVPRKGSKSSSAGSSEDGGMDTGGLGFPNEKVGLGFDIIRCGVRRDPT
jgi:hypothetical protein